MAAATAEFLGPYDSDDYATWEAALTAKGVAAADIKVVRYGVNKVIFIYKLNA